jgi:hypothetical protein
MLCPNHHPSIFFLSLCRRKKSQNSSPGTLPQLLLTYSLLGPSGFLSRLLSNPFPFMWNTKFGSVRFAVYFLANNRKTQGSNILQHPVQQCAGRHKAAISSSTLYNSVLYDTALYTLKGYMLVVSGVHNNGIRRWGYYLEEMRGRGNFCSLKYSMYLNIACT